MAPRGPGRPRRLSWRRQPTPITIRCVAEILGEDETLLWEIASDMEPEDGRLWIYDTDDKQTVAFMPAGIECLQERLAEYKRDRSSLRS